MPKDAQSAGMRKISEGFAGLMGGVESLQI